MYVCNADVSALIPYKKGQYRWTSSSLTRKESSLLEYFLLHQNRIISPEEMIEHIWDGSVNSFSNSIRVHISSLRKKLRTALGFDTIQNKIGQGYILTEDIQ